MSYSVNCKLKSLYLGFWINWLIRRFCAIYRLIASVMIILVHLMTLFNWIGYVVSDVRIICHLEIMWTETVVTCINLILCYFSGCTQERHTKLSSWFWDWDSRQAIPEYEAGERHCWQIPAALSIAAVTQKWERKREFFYLTMLSVGKVL